MKRLVIVQNDPTVTSGSIKSKQYEKVIYKAWDNPWDSINDDDNVIVLGGHMGAYDTDKFPYLLNEKKWLKDFVFNNNNLLGICLGSQMLADSIGGKAYLAKEVEFGIKRLKFSSDNDLINQFNNQDVFMWHRDSFTLPKEISIIASTDYPQIFKYKSSIGIQFHPEVTIELFDNWINSPGAIDELELYNYDVQQVRFRLSELESTFSNVVNSFIERWLEVY
tara:strand:+ start:188 stop:853 length:666 start_codon:yes stop_codon:yes gene_type:complete